MGTGASAGGSLLFFFLGLDLLLLLGDGLGSGRGRLLIVECLQDNTEISRRAVGETVQPGRHNDQLFARFRIDCDFRQGKVPRSLPTKVFGSVGHGSARYASGRTTPLSSRTPIRSSGMCKKKHSRTKAEPSELGRRIKRIGKPNPATV